jgi:carbon-monoxide dehydrogenase large subunit
MVCGGEGFRCETRLMNLIGRSIPRREDERLLTGRGRFTDDVQLDGQGWCAFLRSPHAHARIRSIHVPEDLSATILTCADYLADGLAPVDHLPNPLDAHDLAKKVFDNPREAPQWPLARDTVRHVGEAIAVAIADTPQAARDAIERIEVDYEPLPVTETACLTGAFGDAAATQRAFAQAALVVRHQFHHQRVANSQMEPRAAVGQYDKRTGVYTLISGSQGVSRLQHSLCEALKVAKDRMRVVSEDVGGGFGPRTYLYPEQVVVLWAAKRTGRPVKWTSDRSEAFLSDFQGRDARIDAALALDADGRFLAYDVKLKGDVGGHSVSFVPLSNFRNILTTVYHVPAARLEVSGVQTPTVPTVPYRGAGRPEAHHALERLIDMAARRLSLDRAEIRRRNLVRKDQLPYRTPMGLNFDSGDFHGYMERAIGLSSYPGFEKRRAASRARGKLRGIGIANYVESPVGAPRERVDLTVDGSGADMVAGTQSTGQGHETTFVQALADQLGIPMDKIRLRTGDTDVVRAGGGTHSDRSMRLAGTLIVSTAGRVIEQGRQAAAAMLEAQAADVVFENGAFRIAGTDRSIALLEVARRRTLAASDEVTNRIPAYPGGTAVCEVEIDPETGRIEMTGYTTVDDVGQPINPMIVDGQTHGGIAQGAGQALLEGVVFDASGQLLTGSYMDYGLPRATDLSAFQCELAEDPTAGNPLRVKGGGEGGIVPATAAVINAVCDALGVEDVPMPATPQVVWRALQGDLPA